VSSRAPTPHLTLDHVRRAAVAWSLFSPTTLVGAIERLGFVQADPIRAPARAQDLTLRHRVQGYRAGDLELHYEALPVEEDYFVNYGFLLRAHGALMQPRTDWPSWDRTMRRRAAVVLDFVRERGAAHPREVDARFAHGTVTNAWGGSSSATTHMLEGMHYRGLLRVVRREAGVRIYGPSLFEAAQPDAEGRRMQAAALLRLVVAKYAPLQSAGFRWLVSRLRLHAAPQLRAELEGALDHATSVLPHARVDGVDWYWSEGEDPLRLRPDDVPDRVRLLAPFDPVVWDRPRFEQLWGWAYRFEAYTPAAKRKLGYYALPLLWRADVVGWANVATRGESLDVDVGYVRGRAPQGRAFSRELEAEIERVRAFLAPR
jgi:uncharacterized protein YcaQ